jgi:peptidoglycan/LPS O-acetylase OafA/YrhL
LYATGFGGPDKAAKLDPAAMVASMLVLPQHGEALVNVTWTLTYELFFYAVFALAIANRRIGLTVLLVWQVATAGVTLSGANLGLSGYYLSPICLEFSVGLGCAWCVRRPARPIHPAFWFALLAAGVLGFAFGMKQDQAVPWAGIACALASGLMILALVRLEQAGRWRTPSLLVRLGGASYAIYLVHFSVITLGAGLLRRLGVPGTDVICLATAATGVLAGVAFDRLVDQPIQRWLRRRKRSILGPWLLQGS